MLKWGIWLISVNISALLLGPGFVLELRTPDANEVVLIIVVSSPAQAAVTTVTSHLSANSVVTRAGNEPSRRLKLSQGRNLLGPYPG